MGDNMSDSVVDGTPVWERLEGEPYQWFHKFYSFFRPQGPGRSIEEAYRWFKDDEAPFLKGERPSQAWYDNAKEWDWRGRARAFDEYQRRSRYVAEEAAREEANERFNEYASDMQKLGVGRIKEMLEIVGTEDDIVKMSSEDARKMLEAGVKLEQSILGLPSWVVKVQGMSDNELIKHYNQLLKEIGGAGRGSEAEESESAPGGSADGDAAF